MDIGINLLGGDPWALHELSREKQLDLLAYWHIQKKETTARWLQSRPATLRDLYDIVLTNNGKAPKRLFSSPKKALNSEIVDAWSKSTGSSRAAIERFINS